MHNEAADPRVQVLGRFRGEYGRLCTLAAQALHAGVSRELVHEAMLGQGTESHARIVKIRRQRALAHIWMRRASEAGAPSTMIVGAARVAKVAVQEEWGVTVPMAGRDV